MRPFYATPTIFKATLTQRLREEANRQRRTPEHVRQVVLMDRFLARVFATLGDRALLRGSRAVDLRIGDDRTLRDLDLALDLPADRVLDALSEAGRMLHGEVLQYDVAFDTNAPTLLSEGFRVPGARYRVTPRLVGMAYGEPFALDVSPPEPTVGEPDLLPGSSALAFAGVEPATMRVINVASHLADALHYYSLPQATTSHPRVWDLPEIALLGTVGPVAAEDIQGAISRIFVHRGTHNVPTVFPLLNGAWEPLLERLRRQERLPWGSVAELHSVAAYFLAPVLAGGKGTWDRDVWRWTEGATSMSRS